MNHLIPTTIAECRELARVMCLAGLVSEQERADAVTRTAQIGGTIVEAIEANLFAKIYAGAVRGMDAAMSIRLFGIYGGSIRATREGPLAIVRASGKLEDIDERFVLLPDLLALESISVEDQQAARRVAPETQHAARLRWCGDTIDPGKLRALDIAATDRAAMLDQDGRDTGHGYRAAVCLVKRDGVWHCQIVDLDHARERGLLASEWWVKYQNDALRYAARQPLLHRVFGDVLAGLDAEDPVEAAPQPAAIPAEVAVDDDEDGEPDLRSGVTAA